DLAIAAAMESCRNAFERYENFTPTEDIHEAAFALESKLSDVLRVQNATRTYTAQDVGGFLALVRRYRELASLAQTCQRHVGSLNFKVLQRSAFF
ncbi:MAG: hypothetical protein ACQKBV_06485, partial [Puniceicoccales bacterium]